MSIQPTLTTAVLAAAVALSACRSPPIGRSAADTGSQAPYPRSRMITGVTWDFSAGTKARAALGSDLWPCTWARDDNQYCAWGDGGGFDGNDDHIGRVSLGFARLTGIPVAPGTSGFFGKNVWGAPPYAENSATFGGKVVSLISIDGVLYAIGGFWTAQDTPDPVQRSEGGPFHTIAWSADLGKNWQTALWATPSMLGTFLNFGRDNAGAIDSYVYVYYLRSGDTQQLFLKRVAKAELLADPSAPGIYQYLSAVTGHGRAARWSAFESDAHAIFRDPNHVDTPDVVYDATLHRYLMTVGHYRSGVDSDSSPGQFGIFEGPHPWGPWSTIGYYEDWGHYGRAAAGDFLGMQMPNKWVGPDGKTRWFVFSGLNELDSFNVVEARFEIRR